VRRSSRRSRALVAPVVLLLALTGAPGATAAGTPAAGAAATRSPASANGPRLQARAWILVQPDTGAVLAAHASNRRLPIASTTKLMTALLTLEREPLGRRLAAVAYHPLPAESVLGLRPGERLTVADLMRALLLPSANDAATTLARGIAGSVPAFVATMNARARELGLANTHYATPVGLDVSGNYSSAADLATLSRLLLANPFFAHTVALSHATLRSGARPRTVANRDTLVGRVPWVVGVKTGHTSQAGYVLVGAARRGGVRMLSAVLGDPSEQARDSDTLALLRYGLDRYRRVVVARRGQALARAALRYRSGQSVALLAGAEGAAVVGPGERPTLALRGVPHTVDGPLGAGARVGTAVIGVRGRGGGGRTVAQVPVVTERAVPRATLSQRLGDYFSHPLTVLLVIGLVGCSLLLVLMRRRMTRHHPVADREAAEPAATGRRDA
jgi:D-alanyl-D-alanine carboxypeptidase (penicillin-binding protein 5/6)